MRTKNKRDGSLLTVQQAAAFLNVSPVTIRRWAYASHLKGTKIGLRGDWRFSTEELKKFTKRRSMPAQNSSVKSPYQSGHIVQFYEDDAFLITSVAKFLLDGQARIVIATPEHRTAIEAALRKGGIAIENEISHGRLILLDAQETLSSFMVNDNPDPGLFDQVVGSVVRKTVSSSKDVRAFGEMVAILWDRGNPTAAIELEKLWNSLLTRLPFALYCAYPMGIFAGNSYAEGFIHVCNTHTTVTPAESFSSLGSEEKRRREVAALQQKARSLEAEIEKRVLSEQALKEQKGILDDFLDNAAIGIHWVGPDGTILRANKAELEMLGYTEEEYVGKNIAEFHVSKKTIKHILEKLTCGQELHDYEAQLLCKDGTVKDVLINSNVHWIDGKFSHTRCFTRDITDRKRSEALSAKLATIVNSTDVSIVSRSVDGIVHTFNPGAERMYGYRADEVIGKNISMLIPEKYRGDMISINERLARGESVTHYESERLRKDGTALWVSISFSPIFDTLGKVTGASVIARDITEVKEANRRKDEFLAVLAHELRNPLSPISSAVQVLQLRDALSSDGKWAIDIISRQLHHMTRLIDDLLDISRITSNKLELHKETYDLREIIKAAIESSMPSIEEGRHTFTYNIPTQVIPVSGDFVRLSQTISNLLTNSAKYTPPGGTVTLTARRDASEAVVQVIDSGIGIEPDMLPKIFDMFVQGQRSPYSSKGLGIGLSLVKRLLEMHGGSIEAKSDGKNRGSTFTVKLPTAESNLKRRHDSAASSSNAKSNLRILIVDDNRDSRASLEMMLRLKGNTTEVAQDGAVAIEQAKRFAPDVILMDIGMPTMDGYEAAREIRAQAWGRDITLIALTGWGQTADKEKAAEAGFNHHMTKPVNAVKLSQILSAVEQNQGVRAGS
ncbi:MAG TPA: PAS domain S-box protein [Candidatus Paceibacterota bacterium]|nr:PAS domain S-box protein [Candidatus Paceibacterota bacterium]